MSSSSPSLLKVGSGDTQGKVKHSREDAIFLKWTATLESKEFNLNLKNSVESSRIESSDALINRQNIIYKTTM